MKKVAVGNRSLKLVKAVKKALNEDVQVMAFHVDSGVQREPLDFNQIKLGARNRAEGAKKIADKEGKKFDLYIGFERGYEEKDGSLKIKDSIHMINDKGERAEAFSYGKRLPKAIGEMVYQGENARTALMKVYSPKNNKENQRAIRYLSALTLGDEKPIVEATNNAMASLKQNENKISMIIGLKKQRV